MPRDLVAKRMAKELRDGHLDGCDLPRPTLLIGQPGDGCAILTSCDDDSVLSWTAALWPPADSPYGQGIFLLSIKLPPDYPFKPPEIRFETPIYHPNIEEATGLIWLDILKSQFSPALTLRRFVMSILCLLSAPTFDDTCWSARANCHSDSMQAQIELGKSDRRAWEAQARRRTAEQALRTALPAPQQLGAPTRSYRLWLLWLCKQLEGQLEGHEARQQLSDVWRACVMPLVLETPVRVLAHATGLADAAEALERVCHQRGSWTESKPIRLNMNHPCMELVSFGLC